MRTAPLFLAAIAVAACRDANPSRGEPAESPAEQAPPPARCPEAPSPATVGRADAPAPLSGAERPPASPPSLAVASLDLDGIYAVPEELEVGRLHAVGLRAEDAEGRGVPDAVVSLRFLGAADPGCAEAPPRVCGLGLVARKVLTDARGEAWVVLDAVAAGAEGKLVAEAGDVRDDQAFRTVPAP